MYCIISWLAKNTELAYIIRILWLYRIVFL